MRVLKKRHLVDHFVEPNNKRVVYYICGGGVYINLHIYIYYIWRLMFNPKRKRALIIWPSRELHGNFTDCGVLHRWPTKLYKVKQQSVPTKFTPSMTVWNPKYVWNTHIYQGFGAHWNEIFGLFLVFYFTGAQNGDILAKVLQTLIDAPPDQFHTFPKMFERFRNHTAICSDIFWTNGAHITTGRAG